MDHIYTVLWHKVRSMAVHAVLCGTSVAAHPMHANNLPLFDDMRPWIDQQLDHGHDGQCQDMRI
jgi:hypothetical protein